MEQGILITLPRSDDATQYLSIFSKPIIEECSKKGIKIRRFDGERATKKTFGQELLSFDFNTIIFNGHGSPDCILGHKNKEIIKLGENESILRGRITYARACWSVLGIGESIVKGDENSCFIGYEVPFMFIIDTTWDANPIKDNSAKVFFDTSNRIPLSLIKGHTTSEAHDNSKKSMLKEINRTLKKGDPDSMAIAQTLWNNHEGQKILGNRNAKLIY